MTRCCCFAMWRRKAALALNGTAGVRVSGKEPPSYAAQLPTPIGSIRATRCPHAPAVARFFVPARLAAAICERLLELIFRDFEELAPVVSLLCADPALSPRLASSA